MILPTFKIVSYVLGLMTLDIPNRAVHLVETLKVSPLYGEKFPLQIFTQKGSPRNLL
jgi:hypothetical protein